MDTDCTIAFFLPLLYLSTLLNPKSHCRLSSPSHSSLSAIVYTNQSWAERQCTPIGTLQASRPAPPRPLLAGTGASAPAKNRCVHNSCVLFFVFALVWCSCSKISLWLDCDCDSMEFSSDVVMPFKLMARMVLVSVVLCVTIVVRSLRPGVFDVRDRGHEPRFTCLMPCVGFGALGVQRSHGMKDLGM